MSALGDKIAIRTSSFILAVLLVLTPVTQVLAQAEQQGQESRASQTEEPDENSEPGAVSQDEERDAALPVARAAEPDTVQLLRLGATVFFPKTDSPPAHDFAAATPMAAAMHPAVKVVIVVVAVIVVFSIFLIAVAASGPDPIYQRNLAHTSSPHLNGCESASVSPYVWIWQTAGAKHGRCSLLYP